LIRKNIFQVNAPVTFDVTAQNRTDTGIMEIVMYSPIISSPGCTPKRISTLAPERKADIFGNNERFTEVALSPVGQDKNGPVQQETECTFREKRFGGE
jgi:hypothetical protein